MAIGFSPAAATRSPHRRPSVSRQPSGAATLVAEPTIAMGRPASEVDESSKSVPVPVMCQYSQWPEQLPQVVKNTRRSKRRSLRA
jgi:hypothetical protein